MENIITGTNIGKTFDEIVVVLIYAAASLLISGNQSEQLWMNFLPKG